MYSFMLVAVSAAFLAVISTLNASKLEALSDTQADRKSSDMLTWHVCEWYPGSCPDAYQKNNGLYGRSGSVDQKCIYGKSEDEPRSGIYPLLIEKTKNSYYCVGKKQKGVFIKAAEASVTACSIRFDSSVVRDAPEGAIVVCEKRAP